VSEVKTRFLGLRGDAPVEKGFRVVDNVDMYTTELRQRNPTQVVDAAGNGALDEARISVVAGKVFIDIEGVDTEVKEAINTSTTGLVNLGPWTSIQTGLSAGARYVDSKFGAIRVDGSENIVIHNSKKYNCGVAPPTAAAAIQEPPGLPPPPPATGVGSAPIVAGVSGGTAITPGGIVKVTSAFVKVENGAEYESKGGAIIEHLVQDGYTILVDGPSNLPTNYTEIRVYRTTVGGDQFYRASTVDVNNSPVIIWGDLEYGYLNDTDADLILSAPYTPSPAPSPPIQATPVNLNSDQPVESVHVVFYTYVKTYPDGKQVESSPSPPAEIYSFKDTPMQVSHVASLDPDVNLIRIYRSIYGFQVIEGVPTYFRADEVLNATGTTLISGSDEEIASAGDVLQFDNDQPLPCVDVVHAGNSVWYLGVEGKPNFFYVSPGGRHESIAVDEPIGFNEDSDGIIGGVKVFDNVLLFKSHSALAFRVAPNHEGILVSTTIGCVDRNTISVSPSGAIWLSFAGVFVWADVGRTPMDVSYGKVFQTIIQPLIQDGSKYSGVYYPELKQYLLSIRPAIGTPVLLTYWFETGEWTTYSFEEHPVFLTTIDTNGGKKWLYLRLSADILNVTQGNVPPTTVTAPIDSLTEITAASAITGTATEDGSVFYVRNNGDIYTIPRSGDSYLSEVDLAQSNVIVTTKVSSGAISVIYADADGKYTARKFTGTWALPVSVGDVRLDSFFATGGQGEMFFSSAIVDPAISPVLTYDPLSTYVVGDIVFTPFFKGVRQFVSYTTITIETEVTNGNVARQAWPWPDILNTGTPPNGDNSLYLYDQTGTLLNDDTVHFEGELQGVATSIKKGTTYRVKEVEPSIFTLHIAASGQQVAVGGNHYHHTSIVGDFAEDSLGWTGGPVVWLPSATPFTFGDSTTVRQENWGTLPIAEYTLPTVMSFDGTTISTVQQFEIGDQIFPGAIAVDEGGEPAAMAIYFAATKASSGRRVIYRLEGTSLTEHLVLYDGVGEYSYDTIIPLRVDSEYAEIWDGSSVRRFSADYGWGFHSSIGRGDTLPVLGKGGAYWWIGDDALGVRRLWFDRYYVFVDISEIAELQILSNNLDDEIILLHATGDEVPSTVYWVNRNQILLPPEIPPIVEGYYETGVVTFYGVKVAIESCPISLGRTHKLKRVDSIHFRSRADEPAIGVVTVTPDQSVLGQYHQDGEDLGAIKETQDLWQVPGTMDFDTEATSDGVSSKVIRVRMPPEGSTLTWTFKGGDTFDGTHSGIRIYPPTIIVEVEKDMVSYD